MENKDNEQKVDVNIWDEYNFDPIENSYLYNNFLKVFGSFGKMVFGGEKLSFDDYNKQWLHFGSQWSNRVGNYWDDIFNFEETQTDKATSFGEFITGLGHDIGNGFANTLGNKNFWGAIGNSTTLIIDGAMNAIVLGAAQGINYITTSGFLENTFSAIENFFDDGNGGGLFGNSLKISETFANTVDIITNNLSGTGSVLLNILGKGLDIWSSGALRPYKNGIDETSFGRLMESSWNKRSDSFMSLLTGSGSYKVKIAKTTPFDSGANMANLYGKMMLGAPPLFNNITDPKNRSIANTFLRDAKFLTLTPGMPKYNGSNYLLKSGDDAYHQTTNGDAMLAYLLKNGLDSDFASKDRRYYTFQADYDEYYSYLETMLNTVWIKMGLAQESANTFNIFSFFDIIDNSGNINEKSVLKPQYNTSLGFFVNPTGSLTENISNTPTAMNLAGDVNIASENYQNINFLTGMGSGGSTRQAASMGVKATQLTRQMGDFARNVASRTIDNLKNTSGKIKKALLAIPSLLGDVQDFVTTQDNGAVLQTFATTNGMKVVYPELWSDSTYTKSININFEFTSPYGDPLSIFNYVIAPFLALLCFAMPRQAADNGYVSPFFVRADIPGLFTSDLALIQDFSWTKGGDSNLWTKDGLPRSISGSFLLSDLYPYLAMTKRLSFLSANPNYTVFLDNLASLHAVDVGNTNDALNEYYKALLNRVNGETSMNGLWNTYSLNSKVQNGKYANQIRSNRLGGNTNKYTSESWLRGLK